MKTERKKKYRRIGGLTAAGFLSAALTFSFEGCGTGEYKPRTLSAEAVPLTKALTADTSVRSGDKSAFADKNLSFATEFFRRSYRSGGNTLVSPLSMAVALAMTVNGAAGGTLAEMEEVLGAPVSELNEGLAAYLTNLKGVGGEKCRLSIADSLWIKESVAAGIKEDFLQRNTDYYDAEIFSAPFTDKTVSDINAWTANKTEGMIDSVLGEISPEAVMYLINALYFEDEWRTAYENNNVYTGIFTGENGALSEVKMMGSAEGIYLSDENTTGFIKPYKNDGIAFAALLPAEGAIEEYVNTMSAAKWKNLFSGGRKYSTVYATMPAFSHDFSVEANNILSEMGMPSAFDANAADFGETAASDLYIGSILQKTKIEVSEGGTKAAAVTVVEDRATSVDESDLYTVVLNRPFIYAIVDTENYYPLFIGAAMRI